MPKSLLQDMVKRKTIRDLKIPIRNSNPVETSTLKTEFASVYDVSPEKKGGGSSRYRLWLVALVSILFFLFALSFLFSGAKITINPKIKDLTANANLSATKDGNAESLPFELVVISGEESKTVPAGEEKDVALKAKGRVIIYNTFSTSPQALAIDTRLEGSNGKIYKTEVKTTVPGMAKDGTPGSVEVGIYAGEAGEEYNSAPLDFKIFGFKGTPKYSKFYGRSKGEIISGFKGKSSDISSLEKSNLVAELKSTLKDKLFKKATDQTPTGFILWKDGTILNTEDENMVFTSFNNTVSANLKGTLSGFLFEEKKLTKKIAEKMLPGEDSSMIYLPNIRDLTFTLPVQESLSGSSLADLQNINFNLSGNLKVVWRVDENKLIIDILGKQKGDFNQMLSKYPNIDSAGLSIRPFWKRSLPDEAEDIKIIVNYPK